MKLILVSYIFILAQFSISQTTTTNSNHYFGINTGYGFNLHTADFQRVPDCPSCNPGYRNGFGTGLNVGLVYDYKINSKFYISNRFSFQNLSGELIRTEPTSIIVNSNFTDGEFTHYFNSSLTSIGIEPNIKYNIYKSLYINLGFNISSLNTKDFSQVERITKPDNFGTFVDENGVNTFSRERNKFEGTLEKANSIYFAPFLSISYQMPLNKNNTLFLEPELNYMMGMTNIVLDDLVPNWKVNRLSANIALKYNPIKKSKTLERFEQKIQIDTIRIEKENITENSIILGNPIIYNESVISGNEKITSEYYSRVDTIFIPITTSITANLIAVGVDEKGIEVENPTFKIEEFVSNRLDPLLNYIFFDENSSDLPSRYITLNPQATKQFDINNLFRDSTLHLYHNILNIVGKRLTENPSAKITLIGCNSDLESEKDNLTLSENRAIEVKKYLIDVWNIKESRISVAKRNLPEKASLPFTEDDKIVENRRVEIYSDNPKILEPIFIEKIDRSSNPPIVRYKVNIKSDLPIANWEFKAFQKSTPNIKYTESGKSEMNKIIDWTLSEDQKITPRFEEVLESELKITDINGNTKEVYGNDLTIKVKSVKEKRREMEGDYEIERFSLILFDFDKASIESDNLKIIDFIKGRIKSNSEIEIIGYTDRTGNLEYNQELAEQRGVSAQKSLGRDDAKVTGLGSTKLLYNNDLPEGRFYCRTVNIIVKTKTQ